MRDDQTRRRRAARSACPHLVPTVDKSHKQWADSALEGDTDVQRKRHDVVLDFEVGAEFLVELDEAFSRCAGGFYILDVPDSLEPGSEIRTENAGRRRGLRTGEAGHSECDDEHEQ